MSKPNSNQTSNDSVEIKISSPVSVNSDDILVRVEYFYKSNNNKISQDDDDVSKVSSTIDAQKNYAIYEELTDHTNNTSSTGLDTMAGFTSGDISSGGNSDAYINNNVILKQSNSEDEETTTKNEPTNVHQLNADENPEVITKHSNQIIEYKQELAVSYLRPPTPPAPGEIVITQEPAVITPPAPPLVIRQQPARPITPEPLVVREAPPLAPTPIGRKLIIISGKRLPPAPRKVVIERLAQLPAKPQSVLIERWLPYSQVKRRVIFRPNTQPDPVVVKPRNTIVQWLAPVVKVNRRVEHLGVTRGDPFEYVKTFGASLRQSHELPDFVHDIQTSDGLKLASEYIPTKKHELVGDVFALKFIDLHKEGLGEYEHKI